MCDEAADDYLAALTFIPVGLLQVKCLKNLKMFYALMMIYPFLMMILIKPRLLLIK